MRKFLFISVLVTWATFAFASGTVMLTSPKPNDSYGSPVQFIATATTSCSKGISAMGIYTAPYQLAYTVSGATLDHSLTLAPGTYNTVVEEWDNCGGAATAPVTITVTSSSTPSSSAKAFTELQAKAGWKGYGLLPPSYSICSSCSPTGYPLSWSMLQKQTSPSRDGDATKFSIGGHTQYADALWNNHLIGDFSSQGLPDYSKTLVPSLHNFVYDVWFYGSNLGASQALEFDINQFFNGWGFIWGQECRIAGGHMWDTWDNVNQHWVSTGVPCNPVSNAWNHLIIQVQRTSSNQLLFKSITLNGVTHNLNIIRNHGWASGWYGVTVNYQMDGNSIQQGYSVSLDDLRFSYW